MPVDQGADSGGVTVPGVYRRVLTDQCRNMYALDPRFYDTEDPASVTAYDAREAELNARAEALIERRAAAGDPVYVKRKTVISSNVVPDTPDVPMFERSLANVGFMMQGSFKVTPDDVVTPSELWPPLTSYVLGPDDPLPDDWPCGPRQPSIVTANRVAPRSR
jgi:hypothetical protein